MTGRTRWCAPPSLLKLSNFEETGGIIAAHTTSIPESPDSQRNWDYRFCWLRDAYFVVKALNRLGATGTMEDFILYILNLVSEEAESIRPVYSVVPDRSDGRTHRRRPCRLSRRRAGAHRQCRVHSGATRYVWQHHPGRDADVLRSPPAADGRRDRCSSCWKFLAARPSVCALTPDAGIWEYRGRQRIHTHSVAMCWAGCNRLAAIAQQLGFVDRANYWNDVADKIHTVLLDKAWNEKRGAFTAAFGADDLDASVLLLHELGVVEADDPRFVSTVSAMERELLRGKHVMRYASPDDFGVPEGEFLICRFWLIDAWWSLGRKQEARDLFVDALQYRNRYGLLAEHINMQSGELWGNFPQTYSMAGLILTAMRLSRSWEDRYWRG